MTVHNITVYTLRPEAMASRLSEFLIPFDSLKKHLQQKGFWKDTHEIGGYDGYALVNHYLYGFKATPCKAS